jgi:hypothetical protein
MKRIAVLSFVGTLLLGTAVAQTSAASQTNASASQSTSVSADRSGAQVDSKGSAKASQSANVANNSPDATVASQLQSGSSIHATLEKPVDARKNKPGDQVLAKTSEDVKSDGKVVIPRGSKIVGHVTEARAREKGQAESAVGVIFDQAVLKDGSHMPLSLTVQAVGSGATTAQAQDDSLMSSGDTAAMGSVNGAGSSMTRTGGGLVGGVRSTTGSLVNTASSVGGAAASTAAGAGAGASSSLNSNSRGVVGLRGLNLASSASSSNSGMFTSQNSNVHLDSGTQMILSVRSAK